MNKELIERISNRLSSITAMEKILEELFGEGGMQEYRHQVNLLRDCKAALAQQQEAEPVERATFNAVEHELATIQSTVSSFESPAKAVAALIDWHVQVALDPKVNGQQEAEPVAWILTGTDSDLVPRRYLLFSGREADLHVSQNLAGGEWQSCAAKPLFLHPPKPAAQPQVPEGMILVHAELLDALDDKVRACNRTEHHHAKELLSEEAVEALDRVLSAAKEA